MIKEIAFSDLQTGDVLNIDLGGSRWEISVSGTWAPRGPRDHDEHASFSFSGTCRHKTRRGEETHEIDGVYLASHECVTTPGREALTVGWMPRILQEIPQPSFDFPPGGKGIVFHSPIKALELAPKVA